MQLPRHRAAWRPTASAAQSTSPINHPLVTAGDTVESKLASAPRVKFGSGSRDQANRLFISSEHEKCQVGWLQIASICGSSVQSKAPTVAMGAC